jgi:hypothetical protein
MLIHRPAQPKPEDDKKTALVSLQRTRPRTRRFAPFPATRRRARSLGARK